MQQTLSGKVLQVSSMTCFQLTPQYILLGVAEALVTPACKSHSFLKIILVHSETLKLLLNFFLTKLHSGAIISFCLTPSHLRGIALHFLTLSYGGGCFLGALIIQLVFSVSGGKLPAVFLELQANFVMTYIFFMNHLLLPI